MRCLLYSTIRTISFLGSLQHGRIFFDAPDLPWIRKALADTGARVCTHRASLAFTNHRLAPRRLFRKKCVGGMVGGNKTAPCSVGTEANRAQPQLGLLPQKPGVLHAYWRASRAPTNTRIARLCMLVGRDDGRDPRGSCTSRRAWTFRYFHVPEGEAVCGCPPRPYDARTAISSAVSSAPSPASDAVRRGPSGPVRVGVSEARFRAMYLRAAWRHPRPPPYLARLVQQPLAPRVAPKGYLALVLHAHCRSCAIRSTTVSSRRTGSSRR